MLAIKTAAAIDEKIEASQSSSNRRHLGASLIGAPCAKQLWYVHRWVKSVSHPAQLLRLFQRGHDEEHRFVKYLTDIGCQVWDVDVNGEQFHISDSNGHFGGSLDGVAIGVPDVPANIPALLEFKTHGSKSFKKLTDEGVVSSKWQHYVQMQVYMKKMSLDYGLYMAVNKDNDALHLEIVQLDESVADRYLEKADLIINSNDKAPDQISKDPTYYMCKWCDFSNICHKNELVARNCRTCKSSYPASNGQWECWKEHRICKGRDRIYDNDVLDSEGCDDYQPNPAFHTKLTDSNDFNPNGPSF